MVPTILRKDPFLAFRFEIRLDGLVVGGFSDCSGLQLETDVEDYHEGGFNSYDRKFVTRTRQSDLVLKRGIVDAELWRWYWKPGTGSHRSPQWLRLTLSSGRQTRCDGMASSGRRSRANGSAPS